MARAYVNGVGWIEKQTKTLDITNNCSVNITPDRGKMLSGVTVNVDTPSPLLTSFYGDITETGVHDFSTSEGTAFTHIRLNVNVPQDVHEKLPEVELNLGEITENGEQTYTPAEGTVFNKVSFNVNVPQGEGGIAGLDDRLDEIITLQKSFIGDEPSESEPEPSQGLEMINEGTY